MTSITVTGSGLTAASSLVALLNNAVDSGISVSSVAVNSDGTQVTATLSIAAGTSAGVRVVRVTTPGGSSTVTGTGANTFTVLP